MSVRYFQLLYARYSIQSALSADGMKMKKRIVYRTTRMVVDDLQNRRRT